MFNNILVVCLGNICRSPIGEAMLKKLLPNKTVTSAGLAVEKSHLVGKPADENAIKVAAKHGLDIRAHRSQQLTAELCHSQDLILVMEKGHIALLTLLAPEARGKTMLFTQWTDKRDVPDPFRQSEEAFEHVHQLLNKAANTWNDKFKK